MKNIRRLAPVAALALLGMAGCNFLTGGETQVDPNRPTIATSRQLLIGVQANLWGIWGSDPARIAGIFAQHFTGNQSQYQSQIQNYSINETVTNGLQTSFYGGGGLVDIKKIEAASVEANDKFFQGVAQVLEGATMGTAADIFGDLVYSKALQNVGNGIQAPSGDFPNPPLDDQFAVYDSVQTVLSAAIANISANSATDVGPRDADLVYGGLAPAAQRAAWIALAHTLKARFYMHTAEVRGAAAYAAALTEAQQGIMSDAGNYVGAFQNASGLQNFWYQFEVTAGRTGYVVPATFFENFLSARSDPRRTEYFKTTASGEDISDERLAPDFQQPYVTYDENTLIWAEAAYRTGNQATALAKLNEERANHGLAPEVVAGQALLREILSEKYIVDFQLGQEAWNDYKRTCFPNLVPTGSGTIPGRLYYDTSERQTNPTNIPNPGTAPNASTNRNDPPNATSDGDGSACVGQ
ncbi:MAG TPA: SusD/RagB family nutrient-binding outer membrane lipoprotein [Gemmatimonadaceae bacterium]|nr:SusD/RagB family nutrient-binding outer membrane lipoprotein [Gemmatimonadaceae bacterium]